MWAVCQVTGRKPGFGKGVSHSHRRTNRRWDPNLRPKRFFLASENRWIALRVSAKGIETVDEQGVEAVVRRLRAEGVKIWWRRPPTRSS